MSSDFKDKLASSLMYRKNGKLRKLEIKKVESKISIEPIFLHVKHTFLKRTGTKINKILILIFLLLEEQRLVLEFVQDQV